MMGSVPAEDAGTGDLESVEPWALLRGLVDDFAVIRQGASTTLSMSWPLA